MPKLLLPFVETMITQACNLSCEGCTNYSDLPHKGYVSWENGKAQLEQWVERIDIPDFGIIGGEPLINPEWSQWLYGVRKLMPGSQIRFTTNGTLLHKYPDIINTMVDVGNVVFKITAHTDHANEFIKETLAKHHWSPITEHGIKRWIGDNNTRFQVNRPEKFVKTYRNNYENMMPWNSNYTEAFQNCIQQTCPLLHNGRIYKCSTAGLLKDILDRYPTINYNIWKPYIDNGLDINCSDQDLSTFINNFGKANYICGQCPTAKNTTSVIDHITTVRFKHELR